MKSLVRSALVFTLLGLLKIHGAELAVEAKPIYKNDLIHAIEFSIANTGNASVDIFDSMLPWKTQAGCVFVVRSYSGALYGSLPENDFGFPSISRTTIAPEQRIVGSILFERLFPQGRAIIGEGNAILLWSCWLEAGDLRAPSRKLYGGAVALVESEPHEPK